MCQLVVVVENNGLNGEVSSFMSQVLSSVIS